MILRFLKINNYLAYLYLLLFVGLMLVVSILCSSYNPIAFAGSILNFVVPAVPPAFLYWAGAIILVFTNIFLLDYALISQEITDKDNHVPAFILGLFLCLMVAVNPLHPILLAQLFVNFSLFRFISTYRAEGVLSQVFDGAFCIALSALVYPPYVVFIPLAIIALLLIRPFMWREWLIGLIGLFLPFFFSGAMLFLWDISLYLPYEGMMSSFSPPVPPVYGKGSFLINASFVLMSLFALVYFFSKGLSARIKTQKSLILYLWCFLLSAVLWFVHKNATSFFAIYSVLPISVYTGISMGVAKSRVLAQILLLIFTAAFVLSILQQASIIN